MNRCAERRRSSCDDATSQSSASRSRAGPQEQHGGAARVEVARRPSAMVTCDPVRADSSPTKAARRPRLRDDASRCVPVGDGAGRPGARPRRAARRGRRRRPRSVPKPGRSAPGRDLADPPHRGARPPAARCGRTRSGRPSCRRSRRPAGRRPSGASDTRTRIRRSPWTTVTPGSKLDRRQVEEVDPALPAGGSTGPPRGRRPGGGRRWRRSGAGRARGGGSGRGDLQLDRGPGRGRRRARSGRPARRSKASGVRTTIPRRAQRAASRSVSSGKARPGPVA